MGEKNPQYGRTPSEEVRNKLSLALKGEKSPFWKGGITPRHKKIRRGVRYSTWRMAVFVRDDYTCQLCKKRGVKLNADHIKPFSLFPTLRFKVSNGRTLCVKCHRETPTFGRKAKDYVFA